MRSLIVAIVLAVAVQVSFAQKQQPRALAPSAQIPKASTTQQEIYTFDVARPIYLFDGTPSGDLWFAVDKFGVFKTIIINGVRNEIRFSEISPRSTQISPDGSYMIWMGMQHSFDTKVFNTTQTSLYKHRAKSITSDSIGTYESDNPNLFFAGCGDRWGAILPASNVLQTGLRDVVVIDGSVVAHNNPNPRKLTFSPDCASWAYRSTDGKNENVITSNGNQLLYQRSVDDPYAPTNDPVIFHFSPQVRLDQFSLDSRDYDFHLKGRASMFKTSYELSDHDTARQYIVFGGKRQLLSRWISSVQIDTSGTHIAYFAADTTTGARSERAVVVRDGSIVGGPYENSWRLFMSPSGKHVAWVAGSSSGLYLYMDGSKVGRVGEYITVQWTDDERNFVYATSDEHDRVYVVSGKKRSDSFDRVGRIGFTKNGVEYLAVKYDKLLHVQQLN